jgi:PAS domain-containing protein
MSHPVSIHIGGANIVRRELSSRPLTLSDPICITTLSEGRFVEVNESFLNISGYERQELIGQTSLDLGF